MGGVEKAGSGARRASTGFRFEHTDIEASLGDTIAGYRAHRWIL